MNKKITAVIMAGGKGERFWPKSRSSRPKQFLSLTSDGMTMIQKTVKRLSPLVSPEDVFIVTNAAYTGLVREQLPDVPAENILAEPCARNTAPCIAFASAVIEKKYGEALMLVLPSDHLIGLESVFVNTLKTAAEKADEGNSLVTVGIEPEYPETGYGYIEYDANDASPARRVERFVEKPDIDTARKYVESGRYLWNSGMFIWKNTSINYWLGRLMPEVLSGAKRIADAFGTPGYEQVLADEYAAFPSESIDFGIMEKAESIYTVPGSFGWDDVGSWLAVERINDTDESGNFIEGSVITEGTQSSTICAGKRLVAAVGLENIIIVDTDDALLVCSKGANQDIKKVLAQLREKNLTELL